MASGGIAGKLLDDGRFRLGEDLLFDIASLCDVGFAADQHGELNCELVVRTGFISDGASIPRTFWTIVGHPFAPHTTRAAIFHDWLCNVAVTQRSRRFADTVFAWILEEDGVPLLRRYAMFWAVRLYGFWIWPVVRFVQKARQRSKRPHADGWTAYTITELIVCLICLLMFFGSILLAVLRGC